MGAITTGFNRVFRNFSVDGVRSSGVHEPVKMEIRALAPLIEAQIAAAALAGGDLSAASALIDPLLNAALAAQSAAEDVVARAETLASELAAVVAATMLNPIEECFAAAAVNVNIANPGTAIFDGQTATAGARIFLGKQTSKAQNGIWIFNGSGSAMTRAPDFDSGTEVINGSLVVVRNGNAMRGSWCLVSSDPITVGVSDQVWNRFQYNDLVRADLVNSSIASTIAFDHDIDAPAGTMASHLKRFIVITDAPYNCVGNGIFNNKTGIDLALGHLRAAGGGTLWVPNGRFLTSGNHAQPPGVDIVGAGIGYPGLWNGSTIVASAANPLFIPEDIGGTIRSLTLDGGAIATKAIQFANNVSFYQANNVLFMNFKATGSIVLTINDCQRLHLVHCYFYDNYSHIDYSGYCTTFEAYKCNFGPSNPAGMALDGTSAGAPQEQINAVFRRCYFESIGGPNPIYFNIFGTVLFEDCGFEECCQNANFSGSIANPRVIRHDNPTRLILRRCDFSGFRTPNGSVPGQTYTGVANFIYSGNDAPALIVDDCWFIQNAPVSGFEIEYFRQSGLSTQVSLTNNRVVWGVGNTADVEKAFITGFNPDFASRKLYAMGNFCVRGGQAPVSINIIPDNDATEAVVTTSGTALTPFWTRSYSAGSFWRTRGLEIKMAGRRTGTGGTKKATLTIDCGGTVTYDLTGAITSDASWQCSVIIHFNDFRSPRISILGFDGTVLSVGNVVTSTRDADANAFSLTVNGQCSVGTDTMTLDYLKVRRT